MVAGRKHSIHLRTVCAIGAPQLQAATITATDARAKCAGLAPIPVAAAASSQQLALLRYGLALTTRCQHWKQHAQLGCATWPLSYIIQRNIYIYIERERDRGTTRARGPAKSTCCRELSSRSERRYFVNYLHNV